METSINSGLNLEHAYSLNQDNIKAFYYLLQCTRGIYDNRFGVYVVGDDYPTPGFTDAQWQEAVAGLRKLLARPRSSSRIQARSHSARSAASNGVPSPATAW